jgi:peptide chain release factor 3
VSHLDDEIRRRRTFAIISHPDAGKTTLTEKLLLVRWRHPAGRRRAGAQVRPVMPLRTGCELEQAARHLGHLFGHAVPVNATASINLLDTPGHEDFSEDTYRTLTAVDSAVMVIDCVKGVEEQTIRLLKVCRLRATPIVTFINKLDREGRAPIELLDEIESVLKHPVRADHLAHRHGGPIPRRVSPGTKTPFMFFDPQAEKGTSEIIQGLDNPRLDELIGGSGRRSAHRGIELVRGASHTFDTQHAYLAPARQCPVFFGSAADNFGVQSLLDAVVDMSPGPLSRPPQTREVDPFEEKFSGFIFKIQANMDPRHRDRIAFLRVCSGRFERGMKIKQVAGGKSIAVNNAITFMARDRNTTDEAYAGDIIGIPNHGTIRLGETFSEGEDLRFTGIPSFAPELFQRAILRNPLKLKQLQKGLQQLAEEGATQLFRPIASNDLILGAVGNLQFDVVAHRLEHEYGVDAIFEPVSVATARWVRGSDEQLRLLADKYPQNFGHDGAGDPVYLAPNSVNLRLTQERFPDIRFMETREVH